MNRPRPKSRPRQRSTIAVDPLLRAFFDLPGTIPAPVHNVINRQSNTRGGRLALYATSASANSSPHSRTQEDDGVGSDNSILLGESISLTGDDFYDASYNSPPGSYRSLQGGYAHNYSDVGTRSFTGAATDGLRVDTIFEGDDHVSNRKKKISTFKSLKKLIGYKSSGKSKLSGPSRRSLANPSSFSEDDTNSHMMSAESLANAVQRIDENIPVLQSKIDMIRTNIQSLEKNLLATRNDLARAHDHLYSATMELEGLQRAAIEADIGLSQLNQKNGRMPYSFSEADIGSRSTRSMSSERLYFLTPTSSLVDGDDSDICYTPRSTASFESLTSQTERDIIQPVLNDANIDKIDVDATPLTKNSIAKRNKPRNVGNISPLAYDSTDTPSTAASSMESSLSHPDRESKGNRVTFYKHDSFIRTHDLGLGDPDLLVSLHNKDLGLLIDALFKRGLQSAMDESDNWTPVRDTANILAKRSKITHVDGPMGPWPNAASGSDVLVWSAPCNYEGHGSEYPLVKARGLIPTSALKIVELLLDSDRVKQYNKMSLGREDEHCFSKGVDNHDKCPTTGIQGEAKIVRSKSQPPIIRKPVELRILLHARRLHAEGELPKYISIGRSVWETAEGTPDVSDSSSTRCEMLLSANLVRELESDDGETWCELTTITHAASPGGIPLSIGKRVGLATAASYMKDIRSVFEKCEV